ncbi:MULTISPECIES: helix-turn-helix domain-containing protein [Bordetella]|uniref:HTH cro/C1-type domain-containing protein n=1 Tax=Bordetella genomosp. 6 TaxID=463024 RepID=A0ABX4FE09_9BORD|nr:MULTISPECIES: helix-turn-helix domain-containing protein [Bordetella]AOB28761.1 hypothetical protein BBB44_22105 [Bordetella bronchiseptica]AZW46113.1 hypothetical protein CWR61_22270 [Bordetella bronchiseptica]KCV59049.1 DNA-binding helix-turn-helix protein [Bordetella bronchiseptica 99-R-0433]MBN3267010.1 hypothetical protein [Bordetella bronchiseptica]OZI80403.1 hypothetical protein CAL23_01335 [Bordetella genomosp. 6]
MTDAFSTASINADDLALGVRLRETRKRLGITMQELAARSDLSLGTLSNIERGINSPSVRTLRTICQAMGIDGAELFFNGPQHEDASGMVVREAARKRLNFRDQRVTKYRITPPTCEHMEGYLLELGAQGGSGEEFYSSPGEKILHVITGKFQVDVEGNSFQLSAGDTFGCRRNVLHRWRNGWDRPTTVLLINNSHFYV